MSGAKVTFDLPLVRFSTLFPAQFGIAGTGHDTGLREHSSGKVLYVDRNYPGVSDQRDGTEPDSPLATVQAALSKCRPHRGDTILVMDNNYWPDGNPGLGYALPVTESVVVTVPGVRIVGVSPSSCVGVPWRAAAPGEFAVTVLACDVLVEGFAFLGALGGDANGIFALWDGLPIRGDNLTVRHCLFGSSLDVGIQLEFSWYANIENCHFHQCDDYGVYVDPALSGADRGHITDCRFEDIGVTALSLEIAARMEIARNTIYNFDAQAGVAATDTMINTGLGRNNSVHHNVLSCLLPTGVPASGDYDDCNSAGATDAWVQNYCMDGASVSNPS